MRSSYSLFRAASRSRISFSISLEDSFIFSTRRITSSSSRSPFSRRSRISPTMARRTSISVRTTASFSSASQLLSIARIFRSCSATTFFRRSYSVIEKPRTGVCSCGRSCGDASYASTHSLCFTRDEITRPPASRYTMGLESTLPVTHTPHPHLDCTVLMFFTMVVCSIA